MGSADLLKPNGNALTSPRVHDRGYEHDRHWKQIANHRGRFHTVRTGEGILHEWSLPRATVAGGAVPLTCLPIVPLAF